MKNEEGHIVKRYNFKRFILVFLAVLFVIFLFSHIDIKISMKEPVDFSDKAQADEAMSVYINGEKSELVCEKKGDLYLLPLEFPFQEGNNNWEVVINYDKEAKKVDVEKKFHPMEELLPVRGDNDPYICNLCSGSGKCQTCWPAGSGKSYGEGSDPCSTCGGNGKCWYCGGKGKW